MSRPDLSVVVPMYDEAPDVGAHLDRLVAALDADGRTWELFAVDDGSRDATRRLAEAALAEIPHATVVGYGANRGRGYALRQGFVRATGRVVAATEADLSWGADVVLRLADVVDDGADAAIASPYLPGGGLEHVPWQRRMLSRGANRLLGPRYGVTMATGMTRAYRGEVLGSLSLTEDGKELHLEILAQLVARGLHVAEVPAVLRWAPPGQAAPRRSTVRVGQIVRHLRWWWRPFPERPT